MTVSHSITALILPQQTSVCTPQPSLPSSFIMTHTHQHHITLVFQSPFVAFVTYCMCTGSHTHTRTRTQPTHRANPITGWSSLALNPCDPDVDFTLRHHFLLHHSGRHSSRTTNQGRRQHLALHYRNTKTPPCSFSLFTECNDRARAYCCLEEGLAFRLCCYFLWTLDSEEFLLEATPNDIA